MRIAAVRPNKEPGMPRTICLVLLILWLLVLVFGYATGYFIHIPLFFGIIAILTHIVTDFKTMPLAIRGCGV
jgi:hypothetical protein